MGQRFRRGFTAAEKTELWDHWQRGSNHRAFSDAGDARIGRARQGDGPPRRGALSDRLFASTAGQVELVLGPDLNAGATSNNSPNPSDVFLSWKRRCHPKERAPLPSAHNVFRL